MQQIKVWILEQNWVILLISVPGVMVLCLICVCSCGRCPPRAEKQPAATGGRQKSVCQLTSVSHSDINSWGVSCSQCVLWHRAWRIHYGRHSGTPWAMFPGEFQRYNPCEKTERTANEGEQTQEKQFVKIHHFPWSWFYVLIRFEVFQRC